MKRVIPHAGLLDDRWKKFPMAHFDPVNYKAHKAICDTVEEEFTRLVKKSEDDKKEALEKKKLE